ncbi:hypothetical protein PV10_00145 [Exophiala mesophila]|uniref:Uncharacterized protein n=1 Tax=Exophiala mesophila TaxID=212818 RepID=A0A0D1X381_EXOME|nr:uncharacterized protein PV10_00145 [Exophiala mesophila]KIV96260.1 hypothetical protein PV10_00145 [Exophiala mesophila]
MEVSPGIHPQPSPNPHHRKIELQSIQDLTYLQQNLCASARQKLDLHFPPSAYRSQTKSQPATFISLDGVRPPNISDNSNPTNPVTSSPESDRKRKRNQEDTGEEDDAEHDPLRARVKSLVDAFIFRTWTSAAQNVTVNGLDAELPVSPSQSTLTQGTGTAKESSAPAPEREGIDFTYESYDSRSQLKLASLYGELELLTAQVSKLRRTAPAQGANAYAMALRAETDKDEAEYEAQRDSTDTGPSKNEMLNQNDVWNVLGLKPLRNGWQDDVQTNYSRAVGELAGLAGVKNDPETTATERWRAGPSLTGTVGKVERARTVAMEFE